MIFLKIFRRAFSKNTVDEKLQILSDYSLKISKTPFNSVMPGGNRGHTYLSNLYLRLPVLFKYACCFVTINGIHT